MIVFVGFVQLGVELGNLFGVFGITARGLPNDVERVHFEAGHIGVGSLVIGRDWCVLSALFESQVRFIIMRKGRRAQQLAFAQAVDSCSCHGHSRRCRIG